MDNEYRQAMDRLAQRQRSHATSRNVCDALALNCAAQALFELESARQKSALHWEQVAQDSWEKTARIVIEAYKGDIP